ncbi:hypothetical protein IWW55_003289 [Coemansia sp. RSA 2706]|nr:hypothetical protein IWW55_003289 [Coemansia sp. RSA 2706]KAJ2307399.1 hypothetical protein IWW54_004400 [Coemansia sp. RSA 2705]KAJ2382545.1 hypothetical protein H4S02_005698 [Coemansia sp. RSA 2611]
MYLVNKPVHIAIAGGNYGGLSALKSLYLSLLATNPDYDGTSQALANPNVKITLIDRRDGFVHYLGMTRGLSQPDYARKLWVPYTEMPWLQHSSITIKQNIISRITATHVELVDSEHVEFDYLVMALGQSRNAPIGVSASTHSEYLSAMDKYHDVILNAQSVAVVGGGAVGTELAADLKTDYPDKQVTLIHSRELPVPGPFMDEFRHEVVKVLNKLGVQTIFGQRVVEESVSVEDFSLAHVKHANLLPELIESVKRDATLVTSSGAKVHADVVFNCMGSRNKSPLVDLASSSDAPVFSTAGIRVNKNLQIDDPQYPHIFAVGDVSNRAAVAKFAGAAVKSGSVAGSNIAKMVLAKGGDVELGEMGRRGNAASAYSRIKLVLGEHHTVIQSESGVVPPEMASRMSAPDIKLGKALKNLAVGKFPSHSR